VVYPDVVLPHSA